MILTVTDANIFIDLAELDLFSPFFQLELTIHTTYEVLLECDPIQREKLENYIEKALLIVHILSEAQIEKLNQLSFKKGLSEQDKSILYLAFEQKAMVLTGDKLIRKWCTKNKLKVHGILWLLDEFVENQLLTHSEAIQKLNDLLKINQWLPAKACEALLEKWSSSTK